jgi:hypothetical protein
MSDARELKELERRVAELESRLAEYESAETQAATNLTRFATNEFEGFNTRDWDVLDNLHSDDVHVFMPDGTEVDGLPRHRQDLLDMVSYMPDAKVARHEVRVAEGQWTAVVGILTGTFTEPMALPDGQTIPPTGKAVSIRIATFSRWLDGEMTDEYLFWDTGTFMSQLGLA